MWFLSMMGRGYYYYISLLPFPFCNLTAFTNNLYKKNGVPRSKIINKKLARKSSFLKKAPSKKWVHELYVHQINYPCMSIYC
jgi:hypothetical protein